MASASEETKSTPKAKRAAAPQKPPAPPSTNGTTHAAGDDEAPSYTQTGNHSPTVDLGNNLYLEERRPYAVPPSVLDAFTKFEPIPEQAWMRAGLNRRELARKRRIIFDYNYILYGVTDVMGDQFIDLAGHAGLDDRAMARAERVATHMPRSTDPYDRFQQRYGPDRGMPPERRG